MKKWNIAILLLLVVTMLFSVAFATETTSPLPDISTLNADQLKQLKEAINTRLTDLGELYEEIKSGAAGENVLLLQNRLQTLGYLDGEASGKWDKASIAAMKAYEKATGVKKPNGVASIAEQEAIFADDALPKPTPEPTATPDPKKQYAKFDYKSVSRNPENYEGEKVKISGRILQVLGSRTEGYDLRLATKGHYDNVVYVYISEDATPDYNLLEDDDIVVYAELEGDYTYTSTMGQEITLPLAYADFVEMKSK